MSKKYKAVILVGGTGGHVFPGCNLAKHLIEMNYNVDLVSDKRGYKYLEKYKDLKITILPSKPFLNRNLISLFFSSIFICYSILRSLIFLIANRPTIVFGMGGYASFPMSIAASFLKIKLIIYENNLILGKANKYLVTLANKIMVSSKALKGIPKKHQYKIIEIGNIINKEIINFSKKNFKRDNRKLNILILGGSQAAKIFAETLPQIFQKCLENGINVKIYQHCLKSQNEKLKIFYEKNKIDYDIFNFSNNLINYFSKVDLAITRSGSSILAELTNANIPFVSVPLPSSADNHQYLNALYYTQKNFAFLIEEKDLKNKLFNLLKEIYDDNSVLSRIENNQRQFSDKNVFKNINQILKEVINEKN